MKALLSGHGSRAFVIKPQRKRNTFQASPPPRQNPAEDGPQRPVAAMANNVLELLYPGSFVKLHNQPPDLPPFQLIQCRGGRCWVRQQSWGSLVHWEVEHRRLTAAA
ncbi:MAG: hypothetical protein FJ051_10590 [Cyanobacteria bacterium M_surface_9_m1_291]|nr:hypothetical protein [Cyanobacteria bacterium M_surface_9_m1_291]